MRAGRSKMNWVGRAPGSGRPSNGQAPLEAQHMQRFRGFKAAEHRGFIHPAYAAGGAVLVVFITAVVYAMLMGLSADGNYKNKIAPVVAAVPTSPRKSAAHTNNRRTHRVVGVPKPRAGPIVVAMGHPHPRPHLRPRLGRGRHRIVALPKKRPIQKSNPLPPPARRSAIVTRWPVQVRVRRVAYRYVQLDPRRQKKKTKTWNIFSPSDANESSSKLLIVFIRIVNRSATKPVVYRPWQAGQHGAGPRLLAGGKDFRPLFFNHFFIHGALHGRIIIKPQAAVRDRLVFNRPARGDVWRLIFPGRELGLKGVQHLLVNYKRRRGSGS